MLARQLAIGFGIAFLFPLLVYYGTSTFHPAPRGEDYFQATPPPAASTPEEQREHFEEQQKRQAEFRETARAFGKTLVVVSTPLGIAAILTGTFIPLHSIGTGLILGGIFTVGAAYWNYWSYLEDWVRFVSLLTGFAVLIFVGYWHFARVRPSTG